MATLSARLLMQDLPQQGQDLALWAKSYAPALRNYFRRRARETDIDDLVQDVFVKLHARCGPPIENVERYLFTVAHSVLVSHHRAQASRPQGGYGVFEDTIDNADQLSPERVALGRDEYARTVQAIINLPPRVRQAFQLHRFEHLTYQAIAAHMGISKESVKELMHRALVILTDLAEPGQ